MNKLGRDKLPTFFMPALTKEHSWDHRGFTIPGYSGGGLSPPPPKYSSAPKHRLNVPTRDRPRVPRLRHKSSHQFTRKVHHHRRETWSRTVSSQIPSISAILTILYPCSRSSLIRFNWPSESLTFDCR